MLVYVATPLQFEHAFLDWCTQHKDDERQITHVIFNEFMQSKDAHQEFYTPTRLYSFTMPHWLDGFNDWRDSEIKRQPSSLEKIRYGCLQLSDLMQSEWGISYKLIVQECLNEPNDIMKPSEADLFDVLLSEH